MHMRDAVRACLLVVLLTCGAAASDNTSMLYWEYIEMINASFEAPVTQNSIPGWSAVTGVEAGKGSVTVDHEAMSDGTCGIRITDADPVSPVEMRSERVEAAPDLFYTAAVDVYFESSIDPGACICIAFRSAQGHIVGTARQWCDPNEPNIDTGVFAVSTVINGRRWHHIMVQGHAPAGTAALSVKIASSAENVGVSHWDNVRLFCLDEEQRALELRPTPGRAPQFQSVVVLPERIPLVIDWADNTLSHGPVTFGVPFPNGYVLSTDQLRLVTDEGVFVPAQFETTATWDGREGPVRWALLGANVRKGDRYFLEYKHDKVEPVVGLHVEETGQDFIINTGPMQAVVSKEAPTLLHQVALDLDGDGVFSGDEALVTPAQAMRCPPMVSDARGNQYSEIHPFQRACRSSRRRHSGARARATEGTEALTTDADVKEGWAMTHHPRDLVFRVPARIEVAGAECTLISAN